MRIQLFGPIGAIDADGQEVPLGGPKQRTALALLSVDPGRPVSTDRLINAVWGDEVPDRAARSLSTYMSNLRRELGDTIESGNGSYMLRLDRSQVDVCAFSDAVDTASSTEEHREALSLWRGTPFEGLDGFGAFRDEAQRLDELRLVAERSVIDADVASGNAGAAIPRIEVLVQDFPFDEELRGMHMRALYGAGRQVEALESFNSFKERLADELGLDPSPQLQDLELQILQQDETLDGTLQEVRLVPREERSPIPFPRFLERGQPDELIGREEALDQLDASYAAVSDGVQVIAVVGEPGIGKTSLTATWAAHNADDRATIVAGRCTPDAVLPYQPFIELAKAILAAQPDRIGDVGPAAGNLALLVPEAGDAEDLPPPIQADPDTVEYLMAEAFAALLEPSPGDPATIAILEDLHWADPQSIAVLGYLARRTDDMPLLIIANYRDTDLVSSHPLPNLLTDLHRERRINRLFIDRLDDDQVGEMISGHFGVNAPESVVASIAEETRGNPFFIEELTRHLQDERAIDADGRWVSEIPIEEYGIPEGLRNVIGRRLSRLGPDATALLNVAAVIGPVFSIDMAGSIAGLSDDQVDAVADAVTAASIVSEDTETSDFVFAHALVQQAIFEELSTRRRLRLHQAVGEAIEASDGEPALALRHWLAANQLDNALIAAIRAAETGRTILASLQASEHLELALDLWEDVEDPESVTGISHAELVLRLAPSYADPKVESQKRVDLLLAEIESATVLSDATLGRLHSELSMSYPMLGVVGEVLEHSSLAMELVPPIPPSIDRATVAANHAAHMMKNGSFTEAIETGLEALEMSRTVGSDYAEAYALNAIATTLALIGKVEEADRYFDELRSFAERTGYVRAYLVRYGNQGDIHRVGGDPEKALQLADEGAELAAQIGVERWAIHLRVNAAHAAFDLGRWNEAADRIESIPPRDEIDSSEMDRLVISVVIAAERGTGNGLLDGDKRLDEMDFSSFDPWVSASIWRAFISDGRWRGNFAEGFASTTAAYDVHKDGADWTELVWLAAYGIELIADGMFVGMGDASWLELAQRWYDLLVETNAATHVTVPLLATSTADLARAEGENSPALWRSAVDAWEDGSYGQAKARWRLAEALIETNPDDSEIESNLDLAQDVAEGLGAQPLLSAIRETRIASTSAPAQPSKD